ncbi:hypothetical protein GCM10023347_01950 [Streptomyces chumphonensis]
MVPGPYSPDVIHSRIVASSRAFFVAIPSHTPAPRLVRTSVAATRDTQTERYKFPYFIKAPRARRGARPPSASAASMSPPPAPAAAVGRGGAGGKARESAVVGRSAPRL